MSVKLYEARLWSLPSSPQHFRLSNTNFTVLHWDRSGKLGNTIPDYMVKVQMLGTAAKYDINM